MALDNTYIPRTYVYFSDGTHKEITYLISSMKYSCGLDKVSQQLDITLAYGIYNEALPSFFLNTGQKIEVFIYQNLYFRGKIETVNLSVDKETLSITCFDYIRNLTKSKVTYNFSEISAFDAVKKIFTDLDLPYSDSGIFGGANGEGSKIMINHLINNKSAYDACMMIATELHRNTSNYYYMFMTTNGDINIMTCDKYWSKQIIKPCTTSSLTYPDGNMISMTYKQDVSNLITKVSVFDSKGNPIDLTTGLDKLAEDDENGGE